MDSSVISNLLSSTGYICVNKVLIKKLDLNCAIIIGELCSEYNYWNSKGLIENGYFYSTRENIEENTGINEHFQRKAINKLTLDNILSVEKRGLPAKNYYKINFDKLFTLFSTSCPPHEELDVNPVDLNNNKEKIINNNNKYIYTNSYELVENTPKERIKEKNILKGKCDDIINSYNSICVSLPKVLKLTDSRKKTIKTRLKSYTEEQLKEAFEKAEKSSFLTGDNKKNWRANFDFIMTESKLIKILEGNYDNKEEKVSSTVYGVAEGEDDPLEFLFTEGIGL